MWLRACSEVLWHETGNRWYVFKVKCPSKWSTSRWFSIGGNDGSVVGAPFMRRLLGGRRAVIICLPCTQAHKQIAAGNGYSSHDAIQYMKILFNSIHLLGHIWVMPVGYSKDMGNLHLHTQNLKIISCKTKVIFTDWFSFNIIFRHKLIKKCNSDCFRRTIPDNTGIIYNNLTLWISLWFRKGIKVQDHYIESRALDREGYFNLLTFATIWTYIFIVKPLAGTTTADIFSHCLWHLREVDGFKNSSISLTNTKLFFYGVILKLFKNDLTKTNGN